ncbi:MAG: hypothetical protein ACK40G_14745 [Cytophagaceae bacterium]
MKGTNRAFKTLYSIEKSLRFISETKVREVPEILHGTASLNKFLDPIRKSYLIFEKFIEKEEKIKTFSDYHANPLNKFLDNE